MVNCIKTFAVQNNPCWLNRSCCVYTVYYNRNWLKLVLINVTIQLQWMLSHVYMVYNLEGLQIPLHILRIILSILFVMVWGYSCSVVAIMLFCFRVLNGWWIIYGFVYSYVHLSTNPIIGANIIQSSPAGCL